MYANHNINSSLYIIITKYYITLIYNHTLTLVLFIALHDPYTYSNTIFNNIKSIGYQYKSNTNNLYVKFFNQIYTCFMITFVLCNSHAVFYIGHTVFNTHIVYK